MANLEFQLDVPSTPLEGDLYIGREAADMLGPEFIEGLYNALRYTDDQSLAVYNAAGRNYYIPLAEAVGPYDALQVAGGGNFDLGITSNHSVQDSIVAPEAPEGPLLIAPPSEEAGLFTSYTAYYEDGKVVEKKNINPVGSYTAESAARKIELTQTAFGRLTAAKAGVITPMYVGRFEYGVTDQSGDPQTAILMLVPSMGRRLDSKLLLPLNALRRGEAPEGEKFTEQLKPYHDAVIAPRFASIGRGMGITHEAGLNHNQLTPGNADALAVQDKVLVPYITDWDTTTMPNETDQARAQALDMMVAMQALSGAYVRLVRMEAIEGETAAELVADSITCMMRGYHQARPGFYAVEVAGRDMVEIATGKRGIDESLDLIESWLEHHEARTY